MNYKDAENFLNNIKGKKVLIVGDVMIDSYLWGHVDRISPEAPVPVVAIEKREIRLGGAANVAMNVHALDATPILCSVIGNDNAGNDFTKLLSELSLPVDGIVKSNTRKTTVKTRVIGNKHQLLRVDDEEHTLLSKNDSSHLVKSIVALMQKENPVVLIFEDYDKGVLTEENIAQIIDAANKKNIPVTVDPKKNNFFHYKNVSLFKPNLKELREGLKDDVTTVSVSEIKNLTNNFLTQQNIQTLLITLSDKGIYVDDKVKAEILPAHVRNISDVSGAGDTVISVASLALANGCNAHDVAWISNLAGGLVCEKVGVVPIDKMQLLAEVKRLS